MVIGVQLVHAPAFAAVIAPAPAGTCWKSGSPRWCSAQWEGTSANGYSMFMKFNFNDHTAEGTGTDPRPTWATGIARAADEWELRRNKGTAAKLYRDGVSTPEGYASSPIIWAWDGYEAEQDVGFYYTTSGDPGRTERYSSNGDLVTDCGQPQTVEYSRIRLNKRAIDGTPGWYFEALLRHELGHVFGLCHAQGETTAADYTKTVMFAPNALDLTGTGGCRGTQYDNKYHCESLSVTSASAKAAPWPEYPPWTATDFTSDPDYGYPSCPSTGQLAGTRCVYHW